MENRTCPYCASLLDKEPKRAIKCPECGNKIVVRSKQPLFTTRILTEQAAILTDFFVELKNFGATQKDYFETEALLKKKWKTKPSHHDILWTMSMNLIERHLEPDSEGDLAQSLYYRARLMSLAQARYMANMGIDPSNLIRLVQEYRVQGDTDMFVRVSGKPPTFFVSAINCCDACKKYQGKFYTVKQIEKKHPIPFEECTNKYPHNPIVSWCVCMYFVKTVAYEDNLYDID